MGISITYNSVVSPLRLQFHLLCQLIDGNEIKPVSEIVGCLRTLNCNSSNTAGRLFVWLEIVACDERKLFVTGGMSA